MAQILQWNSRSAVSNKISLFNLLNSFSISVAAISETWFKPDLVFRLGGYSCVRCDRSDGGGGCAIFVKNSIPFQRIPVTPPDNLTQVCAVRINEITFVSSYSSPHSIFDYTWWSNLCSFLPQPILIMGDFNAHSTLWGCIKENRSGKLINEFLDHSNLCVLNDGSPTRIASPFQIQNALDLSFCSSNLAAKFSWEILSDSSGSDHFPIILSSLNHFPCVSNLRPKFRLNSLKANPSGFKTQLDTDINKLLPVMSSNCQLNWIKMINLFHSTAKKFFPFSKSNSHVSSPPWWDSACTKAISDRKLANKIYCKNMTLENFNHFKQTQAQTRRLLRAKKRQGWFQFCEQLSPVNTLSSVWKMIRRFRGSFKPPIERFPVTLWLNDFMNKLAPSYCPNIDEIPCVPFSSFSSPLYSLNSPFSITELENVLIKLKDSSPGPDDIPYSLIKMSNPPFRNFLLNIYNQIFDTGCIPDSWKVQYVVPILKVGQDPCKGSSYRPIAMSSCFVKIMEHLIKNRLDWYVESNNILPNCQFGFRRGRETRDNLAMFITDIQISLSKKEYLVASFLDIKGAYDDVRIPLLLEKLSSLGVSSKIQSFIKNLFLDRTVNILVNGDIAGSRSIWKGLPQGSPLSPLLFNLYTFDLFQCLNHSCNYLQFADDFNCYVSGKDLPSLLEKIKLSLGFLNSWISKNGLILAPEKSKIMIFTRKRNVLYPTNIKFENFTINFTNNIKFLGIYFDSKLSWHLQVAHIVTKSNKSYNLLKSTAGISWGSHPKTLKLLYNALIRSHLDYASFLLEPLPKHLSYKIDKIQFKSLRLISGCMSSTPTNILQVENVDPPLHIRRQQQADFFFIKRIRFQNHPILSKIQHLHSICNNLPSWRNKKHPALSLSYERFSYFSTIIYRCHTLPVYSVPFQIFTLKLDIIVDLGFSKLQNLYRSISSINCEFSEIIQSRWPSYKYIFTDGSKSSHGVGSSFFCENDNSNGVFKLPSTYSSFNAECVAILEALLHIKRKAYPHSVIFTDSLSCLKLLQSSPFKSNFSFIICNIFTCLLSLKNCSQNVVFAWIPGHIGISGNENADSLARWGCEVGNIKYDRIDFSDTLNIIRQANFASWKDLWNESKLTKGIFFGNIQPNIPTVPWYSESKLPRTKITAFCRLRSGHCCNPSHLFRINVLDSNACECGDIGDLNHIFFECPLMIERETMFNVFLLIFCTFPVNLSLIFTCTKEPLINAIYNFLYINDCIL
jgi:ribonuclease HI